MQVPKRKNPAALLERLLEKELPGGRGAAAWESFLRAHASLLRRMDGHLYEETGFGLGDFDVLAQLARAGGELRMTQLAERALSSRSGMTRRIERLAGRGLVRRTKGGSDGRAVVVALTDEGRETLAEIAPVHLRDVWTLFVSKLDDNELAAVELTMRRVMLDLDFG